MKTVYAFGKLVPSEVLKEIELEYGCEYCTTEFIETLYEYEYRDNNN